MSIILRDLYTQTKNQYQLTLLAGAEGLNHIMTWIYIGEDIDNVKYLKGGELVISTGLSNHSQEKWLLAMIKELISNGACGLILNTGRYIIDEDITEEILALCKEHQFPLFKMPWHIMLSDISQDYCNRIFADRKYMEDVIQSFHYLLRFGHLTEDSRNLLETYGYQAENSYCVSALGYEGSTYALREAADQFLISKINAFMNIHKTKIVIFKEKQVLVIIWHNISREQLKTLHEELRKMFEGMKEFKNLCMGTGCLLEDLENIPVSYREALASCLLAKDKHLSIQFFKDMGIYKLFFSIRDYHVLQKYHTDRLSPLEDYDNRHCTDYLPTLKYYLLYKGSIAEVANEMNCHRNTINYRMGKIKDLLEIDLEDAEKNFDYLLSCYIKEFLDIFGDELSELPK